MQKHLESNIWKYTIFLIANKRIFIAILGAYYLTIPGVVPSRIGIILLVSSIAGVLFEIPSGYLSDKIGHKHALVFSRILILISTVFFLISNSLILLIVASIFLSVSFSFLSGAGSAFMHETLRGLKRENDYAEVMGKIRSIGFAVPILFMVLVPFLTSISFKLPFVIGLVIDFIGLFAALSLYTPPVTPEHRQVITSTKFAKVVREGHSLGFFPLAMFSGIIAGFLFAVSGFRAPYQVFLEIPVIYYGVFFGIGRVITSVMLAYSGKIKKATTLNSFYGIRFILFTILITILGITSSWQIAVSVFIILNALRHGTTQVGNAYLIEIIKDSKFKATLLSIRSQINQFTAAIASFALGFVIQETSYKFGFIALAITMFVLALPIYLYIVKSKKYTV